MNRIFLCLAVMLAVLPAPAVAVTAQATNPILLTFDDGPDPVWTPRVLDILKWKGVHAVFCMTGEHAQMHPAIVARAVAEGHTLCDHSMNHPHMEPMNGADQMWQVDHGKAAIVAAGGAAPQFWRAPYGQSDTGLDGYAEMRGMTVLGWNADGSDWSAGITPGQVQANEEIGLAAVPLVQKANTAENIQGVAVVLLHDGNGDGNHTAAAADRYPGTAALISLIDRYDVIEPGTV